MIESLAIAVFSILLVLVGLVFASAAVQNDGAGAPLVGALQFPREFDVWPFR